MKPQRVVPGDVRRFVLTSVSSVPYAEAVLLLRQHATRAFSAGELARALYVSERVAQQLLAQAVDTGVARQGEAGWHYQPRDEALAQAWDRFADCYASNLIGVTELIHSATHKSAQRFADAFKLRKEN